jgi:hypothetical protein
MDDRRIVIRIVGVILFLMLCALLATCSSMSHRLDPPVAMSEAERLCKAAGKTSC